MSELVRFLEQAFFWLISIFVVIALLRAILEGYLHQRDKYQRRKMTEDYLKKAKQEAEKWNSYSQSQSSSATSNTPGKS